MRSVFNFSLCLVSLVCGLLLSLADYSSAIAQGDPPIVANELSDVEKRQIKIAERFLTVLEKSCLLYTSPSPRDQRGSRMPSSA